jgi:DNA-directed RNA polymerase subunit RPC12/RpoP
MLKCPECGVRGEVKGTEDSFEVRSRWPFSPEGWPVRKCRSCGSGLIVKPRLFPPGAKASLIPSDTWQEMETMWAHNFPKSAPDTERRQ